MSKGEPSSVFTHYSLLVTHYPLLLDHNQHDEEQHNHRHRQQIAATVDAAAENHQRQKAARLIAGRAGRGRDNLRRERVLVDVQKIPDRPPDEVAIQKAEETAEDALLHVVASGVAALLRVNRAALVGEIDHRNEQARLHEKYLIAWHVRQQRPANQRIELEQREQAEDDTRRRNDLF